MDMSNHQLGRLVSESACEREDPSSNPAANMVDVARNTAWDLVTCDPSYELNAVISGPKSCPTRWKCTFHGWVKDTGAENTSLTSSTKSQSASMTCLPEGCVLESNTLMTWCEAKQFCLERNGILFSSQPSKDLFSFYQNRTVNVHYWANAAKLDDRVWIWLYDERLVLKSEWERGQPDGIGCGYVKANSTGLWDWDCSHNNWARALCSINETEAI
ncbi:C-type lectin fold [Trinorchestia longiramus]|nr:C-type lectin fold [Trinorchestia longiramus]